MCGIIGFIGYGDQEVLKKMTQSLAHRGPDDEGYFILAKDAVYLGHRRLSITDLTLGRQPMSIENNRYTIVFNGEIYNHHELRVEMEYRGISFISDHSDTEVLLRGYSIWGNSVLKKLNGMFAFAIYDAEKDELFLARDRFGKKPLYWFYHKHVFAFSSELKSLLYHPFAPRDECLLALKKYFAYGHIPAPLSLIENIYKLNVAHFGIFNCKTTAWKEEKWWQFQLESPLGLKIDTEDTIEECVEVLKNATYRRLHADVPVACFLSGGLDSSIITSLAVKKQNISAISLGFDEPSFNELQYAEQVASFLGIQHYSKLFPIKYFTSQVDKLLTSLDEPLADASYIPSLIVSEFAKNHAHVILSGDGGDELFAGYDPFSVMHLAKIYTQSVPKIVHQFIRFFSCFLPVSHQNMSFDFKIKRMLMGLSYPYQFCLPVWMSILEPRLIDDYFGEKTAIDDLYSEVLNYSKENRNPIDQGLQFFTHIYLNQILTKIDRSSMRYGLEIRSPFLDIEVVNFATKLPYYWKFFHGIKKFILKKSFKKNLPEKIINRPKKGFGMPIGAMIRNGNISFTQSMFVDRSLKSHVEGKSDERLFLWAQYVLDIWRKNLPVPM